MEITILEQDDAACDSLQTFKSDLVSKFGLNFNSFDSTPSKMTPDGMCLEWYHHGYILRVCADHQFYNLSLESGGSVTVVNKYHNRKVKPHTKSVNIMRGGLFGNPSEMKNSSYSERKRVISEYNRHLIIQWSKGYKNPLRRGIVRLAQQLNSGCQLELVCCCKPHDCHGDVLSKWIYKVAEMLRLQS